jgi:hypothetical protein
MLNPVGLLLAEAVEKLPAYIAATFTAAPWAGDRRWCRTDLAVGCRCATLPVIGWGLLASLE